MDAGEGCLHFQLLAMSDNFPIASIDFQRAVEPAIPRNNEIGNVEAFEVAGVGAAEEWRSAQEENRSCSSLEKLGVDNKHDACNGHRRESVHVCYLQA